MATKIYKQYQAAVKAEFLNVLEFKKTESDALAFAKEGDTMFTVKWDGKTLKSIDILDRRQL